MRRIADPLDIRAPSIYKHLSDKEALEAALVSDGFTDWAELCERAIRDGGDPLVSFADAYVASRAATPISIA